MNHEGSFSDVLKLKLDDLKLYGRSKELQVLKDAYQRVREEGTSEIVMVHGYSGTGKSALVQQLSEHAAKDGPFFCSGKFYQHSSEPFSAVADAFTELCNAILNSGETEVIDIIRESAGSATVEASALVKIVPRLQYLLSGDGGDHHVNEKLSIGHDLKGGKSKLDQLRLSFRAFCRAICTVARPFVLFIDDLQWADAASLDVLKYIITDTECKHLLFVGAYRDNEMTSEIHLQMLLPEEEKEQTVVKVKVENLGQDVINLLISDLLKHGVEATEPLSTIIYGKTHGNIFFVLQFLRLLQEKKFLCYSLSLFEWTWDIGRIESETDISDNVVTLVASKIETLPKDLQLVLKVAACLSSSFDVDMLSSIILKLDERDGINDTEGVVSILEWAVDEEIVEHASGLRYKFTHDRTQQAVYSLISAGKERELFHLKIGEILHQTLMDESENTEGRNMEWMMFAAAEQLDRGSSHIKDRGKRMELAQLSWEAGSKAIEISAFIPAANYLQTGIDMLDDEIKWTNGAYELSLNLHSAAAELAYMRGDFVQNKALVADVSAHARCLGDELRVQISFVNALASQDKFEEAYVFGRHVLGKAGESIPKNPSMARVIVAVVKTNRILKGLTNENLLELPVMRVENKIAAIRVLLMLTKQARLTHSVERMVYMMCRMVSLTLRYGICEYSADVFAFYGVTVTILGDFKEGYRYGQLALALLDKMEAREREARVRATGGLFLNHWLIPLQQSLDNFLRGNTIGMETGNVECASMCALGYVQTYFVAGIPLGPLEKDARSWCQQMLEFNRVYEYRLLAPFWQLTLNLMGHSEDPLVLSGEAFNQEEFIVAVDETDNKWARQILWLVRAQLAYYFDDMDLAVNLSKKLRKTSKFYEGPVQHVMYMFLEGLISLEMYRRTRKRRHKARAQSVISTFKRWASRGGVNCVHKVHILEAEYFAVLHKREEKVRKAFDMAISSSARSGFLQDAALANEKAGLYFSRELDDSGHASLYFSRAHALYTDWGAHAKAEHLVKQNGTLFEAESATFTSRHMARTRFDDSTSSFNRKIDLDTCEKTERTSIYVFQGLSRMTRSSSESGSFSSTGATKYKSV